MNIITGHEHNNRSRPVTATPDDGQGYGIRKSYPAALPNISYLCTMKKSIIHILLMTLFVVSCGRDNGGAGHRKLIPRDKFVDILVDIHLMDAITNGPQFYRKFDVNDSVNVHEEIFKKYNVTRAQFDSTFTSYTRDPEHYLKVYDDVILKLNLRLDELKNNTPSFEKEEKEKGKTES